MGYPGALVFLVILVLAGCKVGPDQGTGARTSSAGASDATAAAPGSPSVAPQELYPGLSEQDLAERYFVEVVLKRGRNIPGTDKTYRMVKQPLFKFQKQEGHASSQRVREVLTDAVARLTAGNLKAHFAASAEYPPGDWATVWLDYRQTGSAAGVTLVGADSKGEITGGEIHLGEYLFLKTASAQNLAFRDQVVRHELAHLLAATWHSGMSGNILTSNHSVAPSPDDYAPYELKAFQWLYGHPQLTSAETLISEGLLKPSSLEPLARLHGFLQLTETPLRPGEVRSYPRGQAIAGSLIALQGSGLMYPWGCNEVDFHFPRVWINELEAEVQPFNVYFAREWPGTCHELTIRVPANAKSGELKVQVEESWSNAVPIQVVPPQ